MKISGSYTLPVARERAYAMLQDPAVLAQCVPGCDELTQVAEGEYSMRMKLAVAAVQGLFAGKIRLAAPDPPASFRLIVEGTGKVGFLKGDGLLTLTPAAGATEIGYDGDVQIGGMIAGVGQRLIDVTAKLMIRKFFEKLAGLAR